ncbi:unnamed protein product [Aphanomyces euteiches]
MIALKMLQKTKPCTSHGQAPSLTLLDQSIILQFTMNVQILLAAITTFAATAAAVADIDTVFHEWLESDAGLVAKHFGFLPENNTDANLRVQFAAAINGLARPVKGQDNITADSWLNLTLSERVDWLQKESQYGRINSIAFNRTSTPNSAVLSVGVSTTHHKTLDGATKTDTKNTDPWGLMNADHAANIKNTDPWGLMNNGGAANVKNTDPWGLMSNGDAANIKNTDPWGLMNNGGAANVKNTDPWGLMSNGDAANIKNTDPWGLMNNGGAANVKNTDPWGLMSNGDAANIKNTDPWGLMNNGGAANVKNTDPWGLMSNGGAANVKDTDPWGLMSDNNVANLKNADRGLMSDTNTGEVKGKDRTKKRSGLKSPLFGNPFALLSASEFKKIVSDRLGSGAIKSSVGSINGTHVVFLNF